MTYDAALSMPASSRPVFVRTYAAVVAVMAVAMLAASLLGR